MAISFDKAFGIHESALNFRAQRAEVLAKNLANADTPNYKARDIDFTKALKMAKGNQAVGLHRTHDRHLDSKIGTEIPGLSYRIPATSWMKGGSIGVSGRNLWFKSDYDGIDPETSLTGTGNGQGFDYFNMPSSKSVLFKISLDF